MSSNEETPELKAGHAPAVKVGGMRVSQPNRPSNNNAEKAPAPAAEQVEGDEEDIVEAPKSKDPALYISGAVTQGNKDFPAQAVKAFHEKPETPNAAYTLRDHGAHPQRVHQPRKQ